MPYLRFKSLRVLAGSLSQWPEVIEGFCTQNLCSHLLTCLGDLAWTKQYPGKTSCCWKWPVEVFSSGLWLWLCHHIWIWMRRLNFPGSVQGIGSSPPQLLSHLVSFLGPSRTASEWLSCCLPAGLGSPLLAKDLKQSWEVCTQCQATESLGELSQPGRWITECDWGHGQLEASPYPSPHQWEHSWNHFWVPRTNRDAGKLERLSQRDQKWFRGPTRSSWGVWACSVWWGGSWRMVSLPNSCQQGQMINNKSPWPHIAGWVA